MLPYTKTYCELRELMEKYYTDYISEQNVTIEELPEECLIEIFKLLPVADRTRVERKVKIGRGLLSNLGIN